VVLKKVWGPRKPEVARAAPPSARQRPTIGVGTVIPYSIESGEPQGEGEEIITD